ncbi:MAG: M14 family metallocarboxypeptidase [Akkermansiaceae bacterium]|nr:M14 family metallocarboxypeptidase [Verrucomicrobiales bacterium]
MQRLGKNLARYCGDTIDIWQTLEEVEAAAQQHGWSSETFFHTPGFKLPGLHRKPPVALASPFQPRIYLSAGIHGDEPAGPLAALRLLQENRWPDNAELWFCPCLNPVGFTLNCRENAHGIDLNRAYLNPSVEETIAHIAWLQRQPNFDLCLLLHEDWESHGFYLYEQNPDNRPSLAETMVEAVAPVCPVDPNELIEGRPAKNGIIRPNIDLKSRPDWPEAFYVITHKTSLSYTLEAPSDFALPVRVNALVTAVNSAVAEICRQVSPAA